MDNNRKGYTPILRKTTEAFISECIDKHDGLYAYDKTVYTGSIQNIVVTCRIHGDFNIIAAEHLRGTGCNLCAIADRKSSQTQTLEHFVKRATATHGNYYDYSKVVYDGCDKEVIIGCPVHGDFRQTPSNHYKGGCKFCKGFGKTTESYIKECKSIHGDKYDYSLTEYKDAFGYVKVICSKHGIFEQMATAHARGQGCGTCMREDRRITPEEVLKAFYKKHGDFYKYDIPTELTQETELKIECPKHGIFHQTYKLHRIHGCRVCGSSSGEKYISLFLKEKGIKYIHQKTYPGLVRKIKLRYDFYLPELGVLIEYHGRQHYEKVEYFGGEFGFVELKTCDRIKELYAAHHNIPLIVIKYTDNIDIVMKNILSTYPRKIDGPLI